MAKRSNRGSVLPLLMMAFGALLIMGAGAWYVSVFLGSSSEDRTPVAAAEGSYPGIARVSINDAKTAYDNGSAVFVDVRDAESYASGHIPGALSIPLEELPVRMGELDPSAWIITY